MYIQLSMFDKQQIYVTVERPNGTTYEQLVQLINGETPEQGMRRFQKETLGDPYAWYTTRTGERKRYIKKDAYLACSWRWA